MSLPTVLIVEDREYDRILYKEYLGSSNYSFIELADGEDILEHLQKSTPDIILLDWQMPKVGGLACLKLLSRNKYYRNIPVIVITGLDKNKTLELAFNFGCNDFISKPVNKLELNARVQHVINKSEDHNRLFNQKEELKDLYQIIKNQKKEIETILQLRTESNLAKEQILIKEKIQKQNELNAIGLVRDKLLKHVKSMRQIVNELLDLMSKGFDKEKIIKGLHTFEKTLNKIHSENNTNEFIKITEMSNSEFIQNLYSINPKLTNLEIRHCNYLRMNLNNHEIADIMNVELKSLQTSRYRIKKKLNIIKNQSLRSMILSI